MHTTVMSLHLSAVWERQGKIGPEGLCRGLAAFLQCCRVLCLGALGDCMGDEVCAELARVPNSLAMPSMAP